MGKGRTRLISVGLLLFLNPILICSSHVQFEGGLDAAAASAGCRGKKAGECVVLVDGGEESSSEEMEMDSESNKRLLWAAAAATGKRYISYEALKGDTVPCNRPGVPYYNCHALPKANPYARGCSVITGCRGD